jgi:hypothetical protein
VASYRIDREARSGWDSYGRRQQDQMNAEVVFQVEPAGGPLGGGASTPGPVLTAG